MDLYQNGILERIWQKEPAVYENIFLFSLDVNVLRFIAVEMRNLIYAQFSTELQLRNISEKSYSRFTKELLDTSKFKLAMIFEEEKKMTKENHSISYIWATK